MTEKKSIFYFQVAKLGQIVYKTQNNNFQVLAGSASFLLGAYTVGMYKDTASDKVAGKMNFHITIIIFIVNGYTARGNNSAIFISPPSFDRGQLIKERICSPWNKFLPFRVDPLVKRLKLLQIIQRCHLVLIHVIV